MLDCNVSELELTRLTAVPSGKDAEVSVYSCWLQAKMRERLLREKSQQLAAQRQQQQPPQQLQQAPQQQQLLTSQQQAQLQQQGVAATAVPPYNLGMESQPAAPPQQAPQQAQHGQLPPAAAVVPAVPGFKSVSGVAFDHRALCAG